MKVSFSTKTKAEKLEMRINFIKKNYPEAKDKINELEDELKEINNKSSNKCLSY